MSGLQRLVTGSRFIFIIAVACIAVMTLMTLVYGVMMTADLVARVFREGVTPGGMKDLLVDLIELIDLFLVSTTFYVVLIGLYELFVDQHVPVLPWLVVKTLDDLKAKVLVMVIVVLGVFFLGQVVAWRGDRDILSLGAAVALVIGALTLFLKVSGTKSVGGGKAG